MNERSVFYIGWSQVVIAALAMLATLPGRTQGLGLITESLLKDLQLSRSDFAWLNVCATLVGALFCLPIGGWLDRFGARVVLPLVLASLGISVCLMSGVETFVPLLMLVTLTRGFGQSALSVVSISMVGKWFDKRLGIAMGVYALLMGLSMAIAYLVIGKMVLADGWRSPWQTVGIALVVFAVLSAIVTRNGPTQPGVSDGDDAFEGVNLTLTEALQTPAFWIFGGATSLFGLVASGMGLFNESIFAERGFSAEIFQETISFSFLVGIVSNLAGGALAQRWSMQRLMTLALAIYAVGLVGMTQAASLMQLRAVVVLLAISGGIITVIFFAIWRRAFGWKHLGQIQAAGQMMTVVASAVGPKVFETCFTHTGSYAPALYSLAGLVVVFCVAAWFATLPSDEPVVTPVENALGV